MRRLPLLALLVLALFVVHAPAPAHAIAAACRPFRVHLRAALPPEPPPFDGAIHDAKWEESALAALEKLKGHEAIRERYRLAGSDARRWLQCASHYARMDTDKDGLPDWSALVDRNPARVLIPLDPDADGDGTGNVLDPAPLDPKVGGAVTAVAAAREVPAHLSLPAEHGLRELQARLYRDYGILAVDHTDRHSPVVLSELLFLLKDGVPSAARSLGNLKAIYAFAGHDSTYDIAAFHAESRAMSIGGMRTYGTRPLEPRDRVHVLASLAHELGHALVFDRISVAELREAGERFGNWKPVFGDRPAASFYDPIFFLPNPLRGRELEELSSGPSLRDRNVTSSYALKNVHEWFADGFAGYVLNRLGGSRLLGEQWRGLLSRGPASDRGAWVDYNNVSPQFTAWLDARLATSPE